MYVISKMIKKDERERNMRNFFKKFSALILSATMLLTSGVFLPNVSAAELNAKPVEASWSSPQEIRVKFDRNLRVNPSPQSRKVAVKLLTSDGREVDLGPNDDFGYIGNTIYIRFLAGQKKEYTGVVFKKGSLRDATSDDIKNTEDIKVSNIKVEKTLSRVGIKYEGKPTTNLVPKEGKRIHLGASGNNLELDNGHNIRLRLFADESESDTANYKPTNIEATLNVTNNSTGDCYVTIPENKTGKRINYIVKYSVDGGKTYDVFFKDIPHISFNLIQEKGEKGAVTPQPTPQPDHVNAEAGYRFTVGKDAAWNGGDLKFKIENAEVDKNAAGDKVIDRFQGIEVDGQTVDPSNYDAKAGSVVLTLKESYIRSLTSGRHTIKAKFRGGETASTSFTVTKASANNNINQSASANKTSVAKKNLAKKNVVKTDDNTNMFADILALILATSALVGIATYRRKRA